MRCFGVDGLTNHYYQAARPPQTKAQQRGVADSANVADQ